MHQRKLVAQPRKYSTNEKKKWPSTYIPCPICGTLMAKKSKSCLTCHNSKRKPIIEGTFRIKGKECRIVNLTQNQFTIVEKIDHDFIVQWNWNAFKSVKYYATRNEYAGKKKQRTVHMHRAILERALGRPIRKGCVCDHINGCGLDNRRSNLREATAAQNCVNADVRGNNISGYIGVCWHKRTSNWQARVTVRGKRISVGYFPTAQAAAEARDEAAIELQEGFAVLNFPHHQETA